MVGFGEKWRITVSSERRVDKTETKKISESIGRVFDEMGGIKVAH